MKYIDLKNRNLTFSDLLKQDEILVPQVWPGDHKVTGLALHSSEIQGGDVFLAIPPLTDQDKGQRYLQEAIDRKAAIIIKQRHIPMPTVPAGIVCLDVEDARKVRALIAQRIFHGQPKKVVGVTGTNGKTSVVNFTRQLWELLGHKAASVGTMGFQSDVAVSGIDDLMLTSPDPFALHEMLMTAKKAGITHLALEASSHGIDQHRIDGVEFCAGGFTNLSHDHLDYHGNMDDYFTAKARFFKDVIPEGETAVLNADTNYFEPLVQISKEKGLRVYSYGKQADDLYLENITIEGSTQVVQLSVMKKSYTLRLNFIGKFQVLNALCALGLVVGSGESFEVVVPLLEKLKPVAGRLELIGRTKEGGSVYVDYAHTPDAMHEALLSVRPYVSGVLTCVFGCGGDRDKEKRPLMGMIAGLYSDAQIITDDNPRSENPAEIRRSILERCSNAAEVGDRRDAIQKAIDRLGKNDACLIAGKGHEQFQLVKDAKIPFDDRQIIKEILEKSGGAIAA